MLLLGLSAALAADPRDFAPIDAVLDPTDVVDVDTGTDPTTLRYAAVVWPGVVSSDGAAVFTFGRVVVSHDVIAHGARPFVLLSQSDAVVSARVDVSATGVAGGPGGFAGGPTPEQNGLGPGGGRAHVTYSGLYGGSGGGFGGAGGPAGAHFYVQGGLGGATYGDLASALQGGSGGASSYYELGGGGGGAFELGALGPVTLTSTSSLLANGAPGQRLNIYGASGGGSGGALFVHGYGGAAEGLIQARGGAGGAGYYDGAGGGGGRVLLRGFAFVTTVADVAPGPPGALTPTIAPPWPASAGVVQVELLPDHDEDGFAVDTDCDDRDPAIPGLEVACNGLDDDCDRATPDAPDGDGDGVDTCADCDDGDPARVPGSAEVPCDGLDNDCNTHTPDAEGCDDPTPTGESPTGESPCDSPVPAPRPFTDPGCSCGSTPGPAGLGALLAFAVTAAGRRRSPGRGTPPPPAPPPARSRGA
jgi:MYXO-CTERM domain-containing protein